MSVVENQCAVVDNRVCNAAGSRAAATRQRDRSRSGFGQHARVQFAGAAALTDAPAARIKNRVRQKFRARLGDGAAVQDEIGNRKGVAVHLERRAGSHAHRRRVRDGVGRAQPGIARVRYDQITRNHHPAPGTAHDQSARRDEGRATVEVGRGGSEREGSKTRFGERRSARENDRIRHRQTAGDGDDGTGRKTQPAGGVARREIVIAGVGRVEREVSDIDGQAGTDRYCTSSSTAGSEDRIGRRGVVPSDIIGTILPSVCGGVPTAGTILRIGSGRVGIPRQ